MSQESVSPQQPGAAAGKAKIKSGVHTREVPAGQTVGQLRKEYGALFRIPEGAVGYSGNNQLSDDTVVTPDMTIEFVKKSGEKGTV